MYIHIDWAWLSHTVLIPEVSILDYIITWQSTYIYIYNIIQPHVCIIAEPLQSPLRLVKWIPTNDSGTFGCPRAAINWAWPHLLERSPRGFGGTLIFLCCTNPLKNHWNLAFPLAAWVCPLRLNPQENLAESLQLPEIKNKTIQFSLKVNKKHLLPISSPNQHR